MQKKLNENGFAHITQRNKFTVGEMIEIMKPDGRNTQQPFVQSMMKMEIL